MSFLVTCHLSPDRKKEMPRLKASHLAYIREHLEEISFGGDVCEEGAPPDRICYCLRKDTKEEALDFVDRDPYSPLYEAVEIVRFEQRIPGLFES